MIRDMALPPFSEQVLDPQDNADDGQPDFLPGLHHQPVLVSLSDPMRTFSVAPSSPEMV
jgi:hypothetical protein